MISRRRMPERGPLMIGFRSLSSRNAKWWYSAFHNVTAMAELGWYVSLMIPTTTYLYIESWSGHSCFLMNHHVVHSMANG
ncbi:unnamed protein product, partial [Vitis vinifera]